MYVGYMDTILGLLKIKASNKYLLEVILIKHRDEKENKNIIVEKTISELQEYFEGKRKIFDIKIKLEGTLFQRKVLEELYKVPYGEKISYKGLAIKAGSPKACRAVGTIVSKNKLLIIVPCHRVLNTGKGLGGFSSGGLENKKKLLKLENII